MDYPTDDQLHSAIDATLRTIPEIPSAESEWAMPKDNGKLRTIVQLNIADSTALRQYTSDLIHAVMLWQERSVRYSQQVERVLKSGDGAKLIKFLTDMGPVRGQQQRELIDTLVMDWRIALLTSTDLELTNLVYWLQDYADTATSAMVESGAEEDPSENTENFTS